MYLSCLLSQLVFLRCSYANQLTYISARYGFLILITSCTKVSHTHVSDKCWFINLIRLVVTRCFYKQTYYLSVLILQYYYICKYIY